MNILQSLRNFAEESFDRLAAYVEVFNVRNIADIVLVTVLVYFAIQLLRRSNAFSVMKGVFLLLIILLLSQLLQLHTLNFLLMSTLQVGLLAFVVLFQPELRKMLGQVGTSTNFNFGRGNSKNYLEDCILETVEACRGLSWERQGALIVFERRVILSDFSETGTQLDASVTASLIKNIFYPRAPLHDGAIIIRNGRITGAGCMLPLSENQNISRDLGMRHRAGIGMSEQTDAVVVIVSEETGSTSAAIGGMLKRHLAPETLEKLLRMELISAEQTKDKKGFFGLISKFIKKGE